ncbi:pentapeptide repeat-containing protein [Listeria monocytogenes]|uniref:pentapeptide repeat-containing protein n=2 Tax=Listeria monocytogenes TaxID=1639 RepID=UPI000BE11D1C|nr:pentapeptide repeat-containing protein [Listeria monocytogenes]EAC4407184.1 pentapeptide repeat-containing protein [Listeria monocytogenes]EAC4410708.1 pentapeptide repeat-containing protein [Listeria monocytogenes]EAC4413938.1 pentapeptide repeat-containing protein [Listeria monocytogenes]EAD4294471.1 pentapeptide repeat-containing protein [Listeria monocytogenes]EAD4300622.1 pentapeptide repeat-containing protein [Listeria monocytogenes]
MKKEELDIILENHGKWLRDEGGERADLTSADLRHTNLSNAVLTGADLRHANLTNADLSNADLSNADLSNADLSNADLSNANLTNAVLTWVNWQDVRGLTVVAVQVDTTRKNNQIAYIKELHIWTTGCFQGKLYKLKSSIEKTHKDNEKLRKRYYRVIDFILKEVAE